ncbi:MAG: hypothetical protein ACOCVQ_03125, partial [Bacillota bacterium]
ESGHRDIGRRVADSAVDVLITALTPADLIGAEALKSGFPAGAYRHLEDLDELCQNLPTSIRAGDVVLVKASRSCQFERCVDAICASPGREGGEV